MRGRQAILTDETAASSSPRFRRTRRSLSESRGVVNAIGDVAPRNDTVVGANFGRAGQGPKMYPRRVSRLMERTAVGEGEWRVFERNY